MQGSFRVWTQPVKDDVTLYRRLSLAETILGMVDPLRTDTITNTKPPANLMEYICTVHKPVNTTYKIRDRSLSYHTRPVKRSISRNGSSEISYPACYTHCTNLEKHFRSIAKGMIDFFFIKTFFVITFKPSTPSRVIWSSFPLNWILIAVFPLLQWQLLL